MKRNGTSGRNNTGAGENICSEGTTPANAGTPPISRKSAGGNSIARNGGDDPPRPREIGDAVEREPHRRLSSGFTIFLLRNCYGATGRTNTNTSGKVREREVLLSLGCSRRARPLPRGLTGHVAASQLAPFAGTGQAHCAPRSKTDSRPFRQRKKIK